jgi:filamentous hemagglutinin family protein
MRRSALGGVLLVVAGAQTAQALPQLASIPSQVVHAPVITSTSANSTTVTLKQTRTIIDWSSFNVSQGQQVDFLFANNSGIVLNRVNSLATIDGKLLGCVITCGAGGSIGGNVWIFSPDGVLFGQHAQVNVGGLLATTSPLLSETDFLNASNFNFTFGAGAPNARVTVQSGAQLLAHQSLALISSAVLTGAGSTISADGTALYGAADSFVVHFDQSAGNGLNLIDFEVPASALTDGSTSTTPLTLAGATTAGKVIIAAVSRPSVMKAVISLDGVVTASGVSDAGGGDILLTASGGPATVQVIGDLRASRSVSLQAPDGGAIDISGTVTASEGGGGAILVGGSGTGSVDLAKGSALEASATGASLPGGSIVVTGQSLTVDGSLTATGGARGGTILIGGGARGQDAVVANAQTTTVGSDALIDASASGRGGQVVVWSDQATQFQGRIVSQGATAGGDAEVSSAGQLAYAGTADLRAANGTAGQLLLDPSELIIVPSGGSGTVVGGVNPTPTSASSTLGADAIDAALVMSNVTISTHMSATGGDGVIEFNGGAGPLVFNNTGSTARTLTFDPEAGFLFSTSLVAKGPLNLDLNAGASPITVPTGESIHVVDGSLTLTGSNLLLQGDISAAPLVLNATGAITQTGGIISSSMVTGSSGGATSLNHANVITNLKNFTSGGDLSLTTIADGAVINISAAGVVAVTSTAGTLFANGVVAGSSAALNVAGDLYITGNLTAPSTSLTATGAINALGSAITATTLSASAQNGISLTGPNVVGSLGSVVNTGAGGIAFADTGGFNLTSNVFAPGQPVSLVSTNGAITQSAGVITASIFSASAASGLSFADGNAILSLAGLASGSGDITFATTSDLAINGDVAAPGQTVTLSAGGAMTQSATSVITAATFSASAGAGLNLASENEIATVTSLSNSGAGGLTFNDNQPVTINSVSLGGGDISLSTDSGDLTLTGAVNSPGALTLSAPRAITGTTISSAGDTTITATDLVYGTVTLTSASAGGNYSISGVTMNAGALQPTFSGAASNLDVAFIGTTGTSDISGVALSAPGSVTVSANDSTLSIGTIHAGANVTLSSQGTLLGGEGGGITAQNLTASAVDGLQLGGSNSVANVIAFTNSQAGSIYFENGPSVTIGSVAQGGSGSVTLVSQSGDLTMNSAINAASSVYLSAGGALTVDGLTSASDVTLLAGGALVETPGATINLTGGYYYSNYSATAQTMNAGAEQPVFSGGYGNLSLTFTQTGGTTDLTGVPLSAPQSVSVRANSENLTVDSISAGSNVTLYSSGVLAAAPNATIDLIGSYNLTASSVSLANPAIVQPTFAPTSYGSLTLDFTQTGGVINLTGVPLSAPQAVSVSASGSGAGLTVDAVTAGYYISLSANAALTTVGTATAPSFVNFSGGSITADSIVSGGNISLYSGGVIGAAPGATFSLPGSYNLTATTVSLANPAIVQPTFAPTGFGSLNLDFTQSGGTIDLTGVPLSAPGSISITASNNPTLILDAMTAGGDVTVGSGYYYYTIAALTVVGPISAGGTVNLSTGDYYGGPLTTAAITAGGDVDVASGLYSGGAVSTGPISAGGNVNLSAGFYSGGPMTVSSITAGQDVTLDAGAALGVVVGTGPVTVNLGGNYTAQGSTIDPSLYQPTYAMGSSGNLSLTTTGTGGLDLTGVPLSAPSSVSVSANGGGLTVDSITAGTDITLYASGAVNAADVSPTPTMTLSGNYTVTGNTIDPTLYQPVFVSPGLGNLSLTFTGSGGVDLFSYSLTAPGSISLTANNEDLTVGVLTAGGNVTLSSYYANLRAGEGTAISVGGDYSATGSTISPTLFQPTFTSQSGSLSLLFTGSGGADLTGYPLTAPGSVSVSAPSENLTVASITAGGDVTLQSGGALVGVEGAAISLFGDYQASANTISPNLLQPVFTEGSSGSLSLTFYSSSAPIDLTGSPLTAPGSITINAYYEPLTVDSLTAGSNISLTTAGALSAASEATFTLGGNYSAQALSIDLTNPTTVQPTFTPGSFGSLSLYYTQNTGTVDLTGTPLSAPGGVFVSTNDASLILDAITAGGEVNVSTGPYYSSGSLTVLGPINAGGDVTLATGSYYGGGLTTGAITAGSDINLSTGYYGAGAVTVGAISSGGSVNIQAATGSGGVLTVDSVSASANVTLHAGGAIIADSPTVGVGLGGSYTANGFTIDPLLLQPTFAAESGGNLSLTETQTGGVFDLTGHPLTAPGAISLGSSENLTIDSLTAATQVSMSASGAITENTASVITTPSLSATAYQGITLNGPNAVQTITSLSNYSMGGISFTNQGNIVLGGYYNTVSASGQTVNLVSNTGSITEQPYYYYYYYYYGITADTLTASAVTGIDLNYGNYINKMGPVSNSTSGGVNVLDYSNLTLIGDVSAPGQSVNLVVQGSLGQTAGVITSGVFTASAYYGIALNDANAVGGLGALTNSSSGGISFTNGGDLVVTDDITAIGQTVNLASLSGGVSQTGGVVDADILTGSAANGFALNQANVVTYLGSVSNTGSGGISFTDAGDLILAGVISAPDQTVSLISSSGQIQQAIGSITAGTLNLTAVNGIDVSGANAAAQLGAVTTTSGDIAFNNVSDLVLTSALSAPGQMVSVRSDAGSLTEAGVAITAGVLRAAAVSGLSLTGANNVGTVSVLQNGAVGGIAYSSAGAVALTNDLYGFGQTVSLTALSGVVSQSAGETVTAGTLNVSATSGIALGNATNAVTDLGAVSTTAGGVNLNDASSLTLQGQVQASGQSVTLASTGSIDQPVGTVSAGSLTVSAADGVMLTDVAAALGPVVNSTTGDIVLASSGALQLTANVTAPGQSVWFISGGAITQSGGVVTGDTLYANASTGIALTGANQLSAIGTLASTSGGVAVTSVGNLSISGDIAAYGQTISLTSNTGALNQVGGAIVGATLNASAATGINLGGVNLLTNLGAISNSGSGGVTFVNAGDPNLTGNIFAPGQTVNLTALDGGFNQTGGVITAGLLNVSAATGIVLTGANAVASLGDLTNTGTGGISFTNAGDYSLTGDISAAGQLVFLTSTNGSINQTGGAVTGLDITLSAGAGANLEAVVAADQATVTATALTVVQQAEATTTTGLVAPTIVIESRSGLLDLGDNLSDPGFTGMALSQATLDAMTFDKISFYAGYFAPTNPLTDLASPQAVAVKVGDITGDFKGLDNPAGGLTASIFAGPTSTVEVLGSVTSSTGLGHFVIGDPVADAWTPGTIAISGSIGASGTTLAPLNTIELNATANILMGDSAFQTALQHAAQSGQTALIDINHDMPAGVTQSGTEGLFIGSNTLVLNAQGVIASQNTGMKGEDVGISLINGGAATTVLSLGSTSQSRTKVIDIFGSLTDSTGLVLTGKDVDPSTAIALEPPLTISNYYRVNGCTIGLTDVCTVVSLPAKLIQGIVLSTSTDPSADPAAPPIFVTPVLVTFKAETPPGDPTITGVGSEEIWRVPSCDVNATGDNRCQ